MAHDSPGKLLVLGLGNPILRDDGVGWRVVETVESWLRSDGSSRMHGSEGATTDTSGIEFDRAALGGLALMERLVGYDQAVLVDAIQTRAGQPGTVYRLGLNDLPTLNANGAHDATLKAALALGRSLGATLPDEITIIAVEAADVLNFGEELSPAVEAAIPWAAADVLAVLESSEQQIAGSGK